MHSYFFQDLPGPLINSKTFPLYWKNIFLISKYFQEFHDRGNPVPGTPRSKDLILVYSASSLRPQTRQETSLGRLKGAECERYLRPDLCRGDQGKTQK